MPNLPYRQRRFTLWGLFYGAIGLVAAFVLFCGLLFWIWTIGQARRVDRLIAEIRANGEPVTGEELNQYLVLDANREDVTQLWLDGIKSLQTSDEDSSYRELPFVGVVNESSVPKLGEPWPQLDACDAYLQSNQKSLDLFHEAARRGGYAKLPADYSQGIAVALPAVQGIRQATRILRLEFEVKAHQGDARGAATAMRSLLLIHRSLQHDPTMVSHLVRIAFDGVAIQALSSKLCLVSFTGEELREFQTIVRSNSPEDYWRASLVSDRAMGYSTLLNPQLMGEERLTMAPWNADKATYLKLLGDSIAAVDRGFPGCYNAVGEIERGHYNRFRRWESQMTCAYTSLLMPPLGQEWEATARSLTMIRALDAGIAVELYRRERGLLPDSLAELVPKYLPTPPSDPYISNPMIYAKSAEGFTIYGLGKNRKDDGGVVGVGKNTDEGIFFPTK